MGLFCRAATIGGTARACALIGAPFSLAAPWKIARRELEERYSIA